jgi:hypothetical protein
VVDLTTNIIIQNKDKGLQPLVYKHFLFDKKTAKINAQLSASPSDLTSPIGGGNGTISALESNSIIPNKKTIFSYWP